MTTAYKKAEARAGRRSGIYLTRRRLAALALILAALGLGITLWLKTRDSAAERSTKALVEAYSKRRLIEPRLSGGFHAGKYDPTPDDMTDIDAAKLEDAKRYFYKAVNDSNDNRAWHAHARILIATRQVNKATALLRPIAADRGASAEIHNDFGVCLFEQGKTEDAIGEFNRALEINPQAQEALFNRALCYQRLQLRDAARDDLIRLRGVERDVGWAAESKIAFDEVTRPIEPRTKSADIIADFDSAISSGRVDKAREIASQYPDKLRERGLQFVITEYIQAVRAADAGKAGRVMSELEQIGNLLLEAKGDKEMADFARFVRGLHGRQQAENLDLIEQCSAALDRDVGGRYDETIARFKKFEAEFQRRGNTVFEVISAWTIAKTHYNNNRYIESIEPLERSLSLAKQRDWQYQYMRVLIQLSLAYSRLGRDSTAINYCQQSLPITSKFMKFHPKAYQILALPYWHLGDLDTATSYFRQSNTLYMENGEEPKEISTNYLHLADIYRLRDRHDLALLFARQALSLAEEANHDRFAAQASSLMAIEQAQFKRFDQANESIRLAFDYLSKVKDTQTLDYNRPLLLTRAGEVAARQGDIDRALEYYSEAESLAANAQEKIIPMIRVLRGRTDALVSFERFDEARSNLDRAINLIESYRSKIISGDQRSYFLDAAHAVFDQAIALNMKDPETYSEAFTLSERARARALLEEIADQRPAVEAGGAAAPPGRSELQCRPLGLDEVRGVLPDGLAVLEYSVTSQGTYIFLVTRSGLHVGRSAATTERLDSLVDAYLSELRSAAAASEPALTGYLSETARALYGELILPVEDKIKNVASLCIIPDKSLHFLPFAALIDREDHYLVASYNLSYAPSASVLAQCINEQAKQPAAAAEKIVAIGNPSFDARAFPGLKDLPDSAAEAVEAADVYDRNKRVVLTGPLATKTRVLAEMKDCDVAHLALHCLVKDDSPWKAALVLAPEKGASGPAAQSSQADGLLSLNEMYLVKYPRMKLAVLSACETALGQYYRGEGVVSLVRPFIASRVPTVLASLWPVESRATYDLMVEFHKERKNLGGRSGEALRTAQIKMASSGYYQHPYYWASFIVIGSGN